MKIKKTFQGQLPENKILNTESTSQTDTYSCDYINGQVKTKMNKLINALSNNKATVTGETIDVTDSAEERIYEFNVRGNSKQDGTPTLDTPVEIESCGDNVNLLPNILVSQNTNGLNITVNDDKSITIKGTTTKAFSINYCNEITLQKGTYVYDFQNGINCNLFYSVNGETTTIKSSLTTPRGTFTLDEDTTIERFTSYFKASGITVDTTIYPKIEKGTISTPYSPAEQGCINEVVANEDKTQSQTFSIPTQQPMRSIGDVRDTFVKIDGKWFERHYIARIESYNGEAIDTEYISNTGELSTGSIVDYILATPKDIECTSVQSMVLDKINNTVKSYKGVTHFYSTDNVSSNKEIRYVKDIEIIMNN